MIEQPDFAQDPAERFDVVRADGTPTGRTKARADIHRDGDWHRALHVWVTGISPAGVPFLTFQQRSPEKDTWPNRLDATVGGHFTAGENRDDALREVQEEIGIIPDTDTLRFLGIRVCANESDTSLHDRELQDVLLLRDDRPLDAYRLNPAEVSALVRLPIPPLLDFLVGNHASITGESIQPGGKPFDAEFTIDQFVPNVDRYFYRVAIAAIAAIEGKRHVAV